MAHVTIVDTVRSVTMLENDIRLNTRHLCKYSYCFCKWYKSPLYTMFTDKTTVSVVLLSHLYFSHISTCKRRQQQRVFKPMCKCLRRMFTSLVSSNTHCMFPQYHSQENVRILIKHHCRCMFGYHVLVWIQTKNVCVKAVLWMSMTWVKRDAFFPHFCTNPDTAFFTYSFICTHSNIFSQWIKMAMSFHVFINH